MNAATLAIIQLIIQYGIPGAVQIFQALNKESITKADLDRLKDIKPPEWYFPVKP